MDLNIEKNNHSEYIFLPVILIVALILRLINISANGIWLDEGLSITWAHFSFVKMLIYTANDIHPPLYYVVLNHWMQLFGDTEYSVRLLSTIIDLFFIAGVFTLSKNLFNKKTAIIASSFFALSAFHIKYSQEARGYTLLACLAVWSFYFLFLFLKGKKNYSFYFIFCSSALTYNHVYGLIFVFFEYLISLYYIKNIPDSNTKKNINRNFIYIMLLFIPWLPILFFQVLKVQNGSVFWIVKPDLPTLYKTILMHVGYMKDIISNFFVLIVTGFIVYAIHNEENNNKKKLLVVLILLFIVPIILLFLISQEIHSIYDIKSTIVFGFPLILVFAYSISKIKKNNLFYLTVIMVILFCTGSIHTYYNYDQKEEWRDCCGYLKQNYSVKDAIFVYPNYYKTSTFEYYFKYKSNLVQGVDREKNIPKLDSLGVDKIWLVIANSDKYNLKNTFYKNNYSLQQKKMFYKIQLYLFVKKQMM